MRLLSLAFALIPGFVGALVPSALLAAMPAEQPSGAVVTPTVTYTPLRSSAPVAVSPHTAVPAPTVAPVPMPAPEATVVRVDSPTPKPIVMPSEPKVEDVPVVSRASIEPRTSVHRKVLGIGTDLGVPDGLNLFLSVDPFSWLRFTAAGGTNSASLGGRLGVSIIPMGFGPSLRVEAGKYQVSEPNSLIRTFFNVPKWVEPYVQQIGYSYVNAQIGYEVHVADFVVALHGGYSYIEGLVRSPKAVVVDSSTGSSVRMRDDGVVHAFTWSAKLAIFYMFAGV